MRGVVGRYSGGESDELRSALMNWTNAFQLLLESDRLDVLKPNRAQVDHPGLTMTEMVEMSGLPKDYVSMRCTFDSEWFLRSPDMISQQSNSLPFLVQATHCHLYKRAKHALSEARRVLQFQENLSQGS